MNPYYEEWKKLHEKQSFKGQQWFGKRNQLVQEYSWAVPNEEAIVYLAEFDEVVEVGAGNGYWAHTIGKAGGRVMPYDVEPPRFSRGGTEGDAYTHVERKAVEDMSEEAFSYPVLMVWPPIDGGVATHVARQEPPHILYVGEGRGGCTAEDTFFDEIGRRYGLVGKIEIPSYAGLRDNLFHYVRKV